MADKYVTIRFTRNRALLMGLIVCECGHPPTNHFDFDEQTCAHCGCKKYRETVRGGTLVTPSKPPAAESTGGR